MKLNMLGKIEKISFENAFEKKVNF